MDDMFYTFQRDIFQRLKDLVNMICYLNTLMHLEYTMGVKKSNRIHRAYKTVYNSLFKVFKNVGDYR